MSVNHILRLGLLALLATFLIVSGLAFQHSRETASALETSVFVFSKAQSGLQRTNALLSSSNSSFRRYAATNNVPLAAVLDAFDRLAETEARLSATAAKAGVAPALRGQPGHDARLAFGAYEMEEQHDQADDTLAQLEADVNNNLASFRQQLGDLANLSTLPLETEDVRVASNVLTNAENLFQRHARRDRIVFSKSLDPAVEAIALIDELLFTLPPELRRFETKYDLSTELTGLQTLGDELRRYKAVLFAFEDADEYAATGTALDEARVAVEEALSGVQQTLFRLEQGLGSRLDELQLAAISGNEERQRFFLVLVVVSVTIFILVAFSLERVASTRIETVLVGAQRIGRGELEFRLQPKGSDALARLALAFNQMGANLAERMSEIHDANRRIETINSDLEKTVKSRTSELALALEMATEASKAKGQFLANVSHEIRTPMNGILGMTELLQQTQMTDRQAKFVGTLRRSGESLLAVINDILDLSRAESGEFELDPTEFCLHETIEDAVDLMAESANGKDLELAYHLADDVPSLVIGDANRLRQVLTNLLGNAIKFTDKGEVVLRVSKEASSDRGALVRFRVTDTGIGINAEAKGGVFQAFRQADGSVTRRFGGTGLGLAISKQLVELMGGDIGVESQPGIGSTFYFTVDLPRATVRSAPPKLSRTRLTGMHVLVVDDNETNRDILLDVIQSWGGTAEGLASGTAALQALSRDGRKPFDLAIIDMMMPGMSGIELARAIKRDPSAVAIPLIMLTSINWQGDRNEARKAGIAGFLNKPVRQSELFDQIAVVTAQPSAEAEQEQPGTPQGRVAVCEAEDNRFNARVLVAEDNAVNQEVALEYLAGLGCSVEMVENGADALRAIEHSRYDLLLMDLQMPVMDGLRATELIRSHEQQEKLRPVPIVAVTANAFETDREKCLAAGMSDYMSKPYNHQQLRTMLSRWLQPESTRKAQPQRRAADPELRHGSLDQSHLRSLREMQRPGRPDLLQRIFNVYLDSAPGELTKLRVAIDEQDAQTVGVIAHSLKSSSANVGALALADLCRQLEDAARSGLGKELQAICDDLLVEFNRVKAALKEELSNPLARTA